MARRSTRSRSQSPSSRRGGSSGLAKYIIPAAALGLAAFLLWPKMAQAATQPAIVPPQQPPLPLPLPGPVTVTPAVQQAANAAQQAGGAGGAGGAANAASAASVAALQAQLNGLQGTTTVGLRHRR